MNEHYGVIVVGGGKAGSQAVVSLRDEGYTSSILLIGEERSLPYDRPPLSKGFLTGAATAVDLLLRAQSVYDSQRIDLMRGVVSSIDRTAKSVTLGDGTRRSYDHLILATGARVRPLPFLHHTIDGVTGLRTIEDAALIKTSLASASSVIVIGGGFVGLEVAAVAASKFGCSVTLIEALPQLMSRTGLPEAARFVKRHQESLGVEVLLDTAVDDLRARSDSKAGALVTVAGREMDADLVVYGIGVIPRTELAEAAGLVVGNGIQVDATLRTDDPAIWAIGDCAAYPSLHAGAVVRLESVQNATDHARHVAQAIASGNGSPYAAVPWFWSDQAGLRVQSVGLMVNRDETVVVGDPATGSFSVIAFQHGALLGGDSVNAASDHLALRKLLAAPPEVRGRLTPELSASSGFNLRAFVRSHTPTKAA